MLQDFDNLLLLIFGIMLLVPFSMILLFVIFNNRKNKLIQEQILSKKKFEMELAESQIEIREETLRNISWELHDNIGQLMTLAKIQLQNAENDPIKIQESVKILGDALQEIRALSKSISLESIKNMNLLEAIHNEFDRFDRMKFIQTDLKISGNPFKIPSNEEIIIFRILQEFFSNTIRHSRATKLEVILKFHSNQFEIKANDNGIGFESNDEFVGIGLKNMQNRANLINVELTLQSTPSQGTCLTMQKKYE